MVASERLRPLFSVEVPLFNTNSTIHLTEAELIAQCRRNDRIAQKMVYDQYAPLMLAACRRYTGSLQDAEDVMIEGFVKVFSKIATFKGAGSFEGWIRRIMVNESLMFLRKNDPLRFAAEVNPTLHRTDEHYISEQMDAATIIALLDELPPGYRTVFNLFVIEGYKHREIAQELGISINTSKSQLILAKERMAALVSRKLRILRK